MGDFFDALESLEIQASSDGAEEGRKESERKNFDQGFLFGWQQCCHIQRELGLIEGFLGSVLENSSTLTEKEVKSLQKLITTIKTNDWNLTDEVLLESSLKSTQTKMRLILQKLNIKSKVLDREIDGLF